MDETYHQNLKLIAIRKGDSLKSVLQEAISDYLDKTVPCYNSVSGIYRANTPQKEILQEKVRKSTPTHQKVY